MYDAGKIITGLVIFLCVITFPVWYALSSGSVVSAPDLEIVTEEKQCVESTDYMRTQHMKLLLDWRETVVRQGIRTYMASDGKEYQMSLTDTCLGCHPNKAQFCDQCHNYLDVQPDCWNCHNLPEGN